MIDSKGKYLINNASKGGVAVLRAEWQPGRVKYTEEARKIVNFLEAEIPSGVFSKVKQQLRCNYCAKELLKLQQMLYKKHMEFEDKRHEYHAPKED